MPNVSSNAAFNLSRKVSQAHARDEERRRFAFLLSTILPQLLGVRVVLPSQKRRLLPSLVQIGITVQLVSESFCWLFLAKRLVKRRSSVTKTSPCFMRVHDAGIDVGNGAINHDLDRSSKTHLHNRSTARHSL